MSARQGKAGEWGQPWRAFATAMQRGEVPLHQRPHYARWVRQLVKTSPQRLEARSPQELRAYLRELNERPHLERWQVEQARAALVLMYEEVLKIDPGTLELPASAKGNGPGAEEEVIDFSTTRRRRSGSLNAVWSGHVDRLRQELRLRHYSLRTEDVYADWVRRFAVFHRLAPLEELPEESIVQFLSDLATEGKVAASTQNQALSAISFDSLVSRLGPPV